VDRFQHLEDKLLALKDDIERQKEYIKKPGKGARACLYALEEASADKARTDTASLAHNPRYGTSRSRDK
jgi:hypothetical protein